MALEARLPCLFRLFPAYALDGSRALLDGQRRYPLGLGDRELSLLYVVKDFRRVLLNFFCVGYVVGIYTEHLGGSVAGLAFVSFRKFFLKLGFRSPCTCGLSLLRFYG
jgi:hypothetical protein